MFLTRFNKKKKKKIKKKVKKIISEIILSKDDDYINPKKPTIRLIY